MKTKAEGAPGVHVLQMPWRDDPPALEVQQELARSALEADDMRTARLIAQQVAAGVNPEAGDIRQALAELHDQAEREARELELSKALDAHMPWHLAPAWTWACSLLMRESGELEAYWYRGPDRLPAYELEHASDEFFHLTLLMEPGQIATFGREYGAAKASPWDWDIAQYVLRWWHEHRQDTAFAKAHIRPMDELELPEPPKGFSPTYHRGVVPSELTKAVRLAIHEHMDPIQREVFYRG